MKISNFELKISLVVFFFMLCMVGKVSAQDLTSSQIASSASVEYELSYPGLLPDHPLYFIKAARDRMISFFISNPLKKAEFDLLQADKRVQAAELLVQKGKIDLAQSTFSKAENYFENSLNNVGQAKTQGMPIGGNVGNLRVANQKHRQVLNDMMKRLSSENKKKFTVEARRLNDFEKRVKELSPK